ncbi:MAG TPA: BamA/TamA family outer membrane protein [Gemmatimonadales bacterium]|nr:BamA/TamA family outer membrane protein [Gemmatimonadales bacterium]
MSARRLLTLLLAAAGAAPHGVRAQAQPEPKPYWDFTYTPYGYYSGIDGWWLAGYGRVYSPIGFRERPEPNRAAITLTGGASTKGSYLVELDAQAPALWDGWRVGLTFDALRANRLGYFGIGNDTPYDQDSVTPTTPYFYRVSRSSELARLTIQRRVVGPLRVLVGGTLEHTTFRTLPGDGLFARDRAAGVADTAPFNDAALRAGLVADSRDNEIDPHAGVLAEALIAGARHYSRATFGVQAYVHPLERLVLAGRILGERMSGAPSISTMQVIESSGRPYVGVGGYRSLRGYYDSRFIGPGKLLGGFEARYALLYAPTLFEVKVVGFYDVGRVFASGSSLSFTTQGLHSGGGGELMLRFGRNTVLVGGAGFGKDGWQFLFGSTWSY